VSIALLLGLLLAASPDAATVPVGPAPGAPVASAILVAGETIALDASGSARIPAEASPTAEGLRFYQWQVDSGGASGISYLPETSALADWTFHGLDAPGPASIVIKRTDGETWENARAFAAPLEKTEEGRRVRFAMRPGTWDLAIVVPGFAPSFVTELDVYDSDDTVRVAAVKLEPAARVTARVLDPRSGRPPDRWTAWISRVGSHSDDEETKFFDGRPIAENGASLDFSSLPVGDWELRAEETAGAGRVGSRRSRSAVKATKPRQRVNLGDIFLSDTGALRVVVAFPTEVPDQEFSCRVARSPTSGEGELERLAAKTFAPNASTAVMFADLETGPVTIQCGDNRDIYDQKTATIAGGEVVEVEFSFAPIRLSGNVRRGEDRVPGATVTAVLSGPEDQTVQVKSDDLGSYHLVVWPVREAIRLLTTPPEDRLPFAENLEVEAGATKIDHDVLLPSSSIRGIVRDKETGEALAGAEVAFSGSLEAKGSEWGRFSTSTTSDGEGRFRVGNLLDKPLDVDVTLEGYARSVMKEVRPTPEGAEIEVQLEKGNRLTGVVVDELGAPLSNVAVGLDVDSGGDYVQRTETTSGSGEFDFGAVATGRHLLSVFRCGSMFALEPVDVTSYESEPPPRVLRLRPPAAPIELLVVDENDAPIAEAVFRWSVGGLTVPMEDWASAAQACGQDFRTDAQGKLRLLGFPPGVIAAASLDRVPLGTFPNDGTRRQWTLRLHVEGENLETETPGAR